MRLSWRFCVGGEAKGSLPVGVARGRVFAARIMIREHYVQLES